MKIKLYHNPRCSKSRAARALLEARGVDFEIVEYLTHPLGREQLVALLNKLGVNAHELVRKEEASFRESGLTAAADADALIDLLVAQPALMQRPILETATQACIARPPERVLDLLG